MIKIFVTGETSFEWIDAKCSTPSYHSNCWSQQTFTEKCFQGDPISRNEYDVQLVALKGSGKMTLDQ